MNGMRLLLKDWVPPIALRAMRQMRGGGIRFEGDYASWDEALTKCSGYDATHILDKVLDATLKVKRGDAAFERDSVLFDEIEYAWPVLAGLMWAAARNGGVLNVLDFGGALGSGYFQNRSFLQALPKVRWNVVEQAHYVQAGQEHIQDAHLHFYPTIEACLAETQPNVILLSSVLQYLSDPLDVLERLSKCNAACLIIDRTPFALDSKDTLVIQHVPSSIYSASYPMWIFSQDEFNQHVASRWKLLASSLSPEGHVKTSHELNFHFQCMLFDSRQ